MSAAETSSPFPLSAEETASALFAHLVMQQSNMALMLLGKVPNPESGQPIRDLEAAKLFIDLLDMLQAKTKGNLSKEEANLLKQTLMNLHMAYVEAVDSPAGEPEQQPKPQTSPIETPSPGAGPSKPGQEASASEDEHRIKFSKKY
jgi:hypothetical protein